jgi:hypothetical protein
VETTADDAHQQQQHQQQTLVSPQSARDSKRASASAGAGAPPVHRMIFDFETEHDRDLWLPDLLDMKEYSASAPASGVRRV